MDRKRIGYLFVLAGAVLICGALVLFLRNQVEDEQAGKASEEVLLALHEAIEEPDTQIGEIALEPEETVPETLPVVNVDGNNYIGYLSFPEYELELPVLADWDMDLLQIAPCLQYGSPLTDDAVIAAHNYRKHFLVLHKIRVGERVIFTDMNGKEIEYVVEEVKIVTPTNAYDVIYSGYDLVLYTCTSSGQDRVTVRCNRM